MAEPKITVVVLTYNRPHTLRQALDSVLAQDYDDFGVLVMDNCSTDQTPSIVAEYAKRDSRVRHVRNEMNIGIARNWNRGLSLNRSPYVCLCHDDDLMLDGFLRETVAVLESHPTVGFVLVQAQFIDESGKPVGAQDTGDVPEGLMSGLDLLELSVDGRGIGIFPPTIVMRTSAVAEAMPLESPHTRGYLDIEFYNRIAARHDVYLIRKQLVQYRVHEESDTELLNRQAGATPWYGEVATKIDAIAPLLRSERAADPRYRNWLADRLLYLHRHASAAIHPSIPAMYHAWETRLELATELLKQNIPEGEPFILVDEGQLGIWGTWHGRRVIPFLERGGEFFGAPETDEQALGEVQRQRQAGIRWLVVAWPCFWWLDRYWRFGHHLSDNFACKSESPHLLVYDMSNPPAVHHRLPK